MIIRIDMEKAHVITEQDGTTQVYPMDSEDAFNIISKAWLRCGWDNKYVYSFTWLGRPIIQLPDDLIRIQEIIYKIKPDIIIETGVAHGGGLIFYASLCKAMNKGRIVGVDIEIRKHNRKAIEVHELFPYITLIEGDSTDPEVVSHVKGHVKQNETAIILLDANHNKSHVMNELKAYSDLLNVGSYIVVMDGIMKYLVGAPRSEPDWDWNNPMDAAIEFTDKNPNFVIEEPEFDFNEGNVKKRVTYWPNAFIKRIL